MRLSKDLLEGSKNASKDAFDALESMEDWAIDDPEINEKINQMVEEFNDILKEKDIEKKGMVRFLAYLHTGNMIKVLDQLNNANPNFVNELFDVINEMNENQGSRFSYTLADRILVLYRLSVLPRIISKERIEQLKRGIEEANKLNNKDI